MNMAESISNKLSYFNALDHLRHVSMLVQKIYFCYQQFRAVKFVCLYFLVFVFVNRNLIMTFLFYFRIRNSTLLPSQLQVSLLFQCWHDLMSAFHSYQAM